MNKIVNLNDNKILKEKICILANECKYDEIIKNGMILLNDKAIMLNDRIMVCYKVAFSYKQNNNQELAIKIITMGIDCYNKMKNKSDKDYYCRLLWLKNNCLKDLGIEDLKQANEDFAKIKEYYESIGEKKGANMVGFNIGYWNKDTKYMYYYFKKIVKSMPITTNIDKNHRNHKAIEDALSDMKEVDMHYYSKGKDYINQHINLVVNM